MVFNWPFLTVGLVLLWFPRAWMRMGKAVLRRRRRATHDEPWIRREPGDPRLSFRKEFGKARNYFDLLRAVAGALAIMGWHAIPASLEAAPAADGHVSLRWTVLAVKLAILLIGLLIQTIRIERNHLTFFAPVFFLAGMAVALCGPWAALFTFILVWGVNPMLPSAQAFLSFDAALMIAFGLLLGQVDRTLPVAAGGLCFLPALLSWLARRPLVVFARKGFHPGSPS
jgi:hypothetical protein